MNRAHAWTGRKRDRSDPANLWVKLMTELRGESHSRLNTVDRVPNSSVNYYRSHAQLILYELSQHLGYTPPSLIDRRAEDGQKIHQARPILQERLANVTQQGIAN